LPLVRKPCEEDHRKLYHKGRSVFTISAVQITV
jgi:hypothetical protein